MTRPLRRRSVRDPTDDYVEGHFLVTICTDGRRHTFGSIIDGRLVPSALGALVEPAWHRIIDRATHADTGAFVVMPNHVHAVVGLRPSVGVDRRHAPGGVAGVIGRFKQTVTFEASSALLPLPVWQRSFHDRVLRSGQAVQAAVAYVEDNPLNWSCDPEFTRS